MPTNDAHPVNDDRARLEATLVQKIQRLPKKRVWALKRALAYAQERGATVDQMIGLLICVVSARDDVQAENAVSIAWAIPKPVTTSKPTGTKQAIIDACDELKAMLLRKNEAYGDSALNPVRIFSKANPAEQILVRIDDKLSRIARGHAAGEDAESDLNGYLVLLKIARRMHASKLVAMGRAGEKGGAL